MSRSRLIVVEGIPGSGKTTMARFVKNLLDDVRVANELFVEDNLDHPAEYESVAWFPRDEYEHFLEHHAANRSLLAKYSWFRGEDCFIAYGKLDKAHRQEIPAELSGELAQCDVWAVPTPDLFCRLKMDRWKTFAETARQGKQTYILECCLIQNPLAVLMIRHNMSESYTLAYVRSVLELVEALDPLILYLWPRDTWKAWERITRERPEEWINAMIDYLERGQWSHANQLSGYESVVAFHDLRKEIEMRFLQELDGQALLVEMSDYDWDRCQREIAQYVRERLGI
jgi:hypothetical protein